MKRLRVPRALAAVASAVLMAGATLTGGAAAYADGHPGHDGGGDGSVVYVSAHRGYGGPGRDPGCVHPRYRTIQDGVDAVAPGGAVVVCPGRYAEDVLVTHPLRLLGQGAVIDAGGLRNGVVIASSDVLVQGFTVTGALGEGILAEPAGAVIDPVPPTSPSGVMAPISNVNIARNVVTADNTGGDPRFHQCPEQPSAPMYLYPGDCGGGIHLDTVSYSQVQGNVVTGNNDGILVTDDYGPASSNVIAGNYVARNLYECGIVLPSHNPFSVAATLNPNGTFTVGALNPTAGGVYRNSVIGNVVIGNGTAPSPMGPGGSGSGVGVFAPAAGTAAYDNTVAFNFISRNGQAGFTIHAHYPGGEYVDGNQVFANTFGTNNLGGDFLDGPGTDANTATTAVLVFSAVAVSMVITGNHIYGNATGIWLTPSVQATGLAANSISGATTAVYVSRVPYAFTGPAVSTKAGSVMVGVLITANGTPTTYYVEYGTSSDPYEFRTPMALAGSAVVPVGLAIGLPKVTAAGLTIHYQVVATNGFGIRSGGDMTFTSTG